MPETVKKKEGKGGGRGGRADRQKTVTKKVRKVKEEILDLFPRPVFSSQISPPPGAFSSGVAVSQHKLFGNERNCVWGWVPKSPR